MQRKGGFFGHTHLKIYWFWSEINPKDGFLNCQPPALPPKINQKDGFLNSQPPDLPSRPAPSETNVSPVVLFITVTLAVVFLMSGLLHLLVRLLTKRTSSSENLEASGSDAHQGQLQQLFDLNDSGLDQASIDALPVFSYKEIVGLQGRFDCAVCLCEFSEMDELKLLPMCRHAFHVNCIDTWLLAHSTCPLCRGALCSPELSIENPLFDSDDTMEDDECQGGVEFEEVATERIFPVRLGKFQKSNGSDGELGDEAGTSKLDSRRCYSTGSYQYVVADANLRVFTQGQSGRGTKLVKVTEQSRDPGDVWEGRKIGSGARTDCYSISKIWLWSEKGQYASSSQAQSENPFSPYVRLKIDA